VSLLCFGKNLATRFVLLLEEEHYFIIYKAAFFFAQLLTTAKPKRTQNIFTRLYEKMGITIQEFPFYQLRRFPII